MDVKRIRIGVDIGGTFTDLVVLDGGTNEIRMEKSLSTPGDLTRGVFAAVDGALDSLEGVARFVHGTTAGTNAVVERKGGNVALLTTKGFRDTLEIMRINRERHYDLQWSKPEPLVQRHMRFEVSERIDYRGRVVAPLDEAELTGVVGRIRDSGAEAIALCFLFSFMNPSHERRARELISQMWPEVSVSVSSEILPEIREYERTSTVVIDAYVKPLLGSYFDDLGEGLAKRGLSSSPVIMGSGGGIVPIEEAARVPVKTLQSGPAGGVIGAAYLGREIGEPRLIAIDVGGTSFEVSVIDGGQPTWTTEGSIEWGIPFKIPLVDVKSIGAGGGSIARVDLGGLLQVGPESAGAEPGPACYGKGGELPTLTDAYLVVRAISPDYFLGGKMKLHPEPAWNAIEKHVAGPLGITVEEAANGMIRVARSSMLGAMEVVSTQRGYDPREYALVCYGGAGPLVAVDLARDLHMTKVIVPRFPGAFSAFGMLIADVRFDFVQSYYRRIAEVDLRSLAEVADSLENQAREALTGVSYEGSSLIQRSADLRYVGQNYEVNVPVPVGPIDEASVQFIVQSFNDEHRRRFGHRKLDEPVEFVTLRVTGVGVTNKPSLSVPPASSAMATPKSSRRLVLQDGEIQDVSVFERDELPIGWSSVGPLIIEEQDSTVLCAPGDEISVDDFGNLVIQLGQESDGP